jgi:hypothetical protein
VKADCKHEGPLSLELNKSKKLLIVAKKWAVPIAAAGSIPKAIYVSVSAKTYRITCPSGDSA